MIAPGQSIEVDAELGYFTEGNDISLRVTALNPEALHIQQGNFKEWDFEFAGQKKSDSQFYFSDNFAMIVTDTSLSI